MISLTRLSGSAFAINSDLIERIDATPDTVITLIGGTKYVVSESLDEVVATVRRHRAEVLALSTTYGLGEDVPDVYPQPAAALRRVLSVVNPEVPR